MDAHHPQLTDLFKRRQKAAGPAPSTQTVDWSPLMNLCAGHYRAEHRAELQRDSSAELWQAYTQASIAQNASSGDKRLHDLREALCHLDKKYNRSAHQRSFHDAFIASCIRNIYKDEYSANHLRILSENHWKECRQEVFICCPRRFGKTFAVAMYCAAYAMTQPEQRICIFSPSRRQSKMLLDQIKKFISEYEGGMERIKKFNQEELWIEGDDPNDVRVICSYPSKVSIGKGFSKWPKSKSNKAQRRGRWKIAPGTFFF